MLALCELAPLTIRYQIHKIIFLKPVLDIQCSNSYNLALFQKPTEFGDIMFSLSYLPTAERLTIVIVKARNLHWTESKESGGNYLFQ